MTIYNNFGSDKKRLDGVQSNHKKKISHFIDFSNISEHEIMKIISSSLKIQQSLKNQIFTTKKNKKKIIAFIFTEPSTRTSFSFQIAANYLGYRIIKDDLQNSSILKGENFYETIMNISQMHIDGFIIRHANNDDIKKIANDINIPIINAGSGIMNHPSQALGDLSLICSLYKENWKKKKIAIIGDIFHSRVANSFCQLMNKFKKELYLFGPEKPEFNLGHHLYTDNEKEIEGFDILMCLRPQKERHNNKKEINFKKYKIEEKILKKQNENCLIMHPGPCNFEDDIDFNLANDPRISLIKNQVAQGMATRIAILNKFIR